MRIYTPKTFFYDFWFETRFPKILQTFLNKLKNGFIFTEDELLCNDKLPSIYVTIADILFDSLLIFHGPVRYNYPTKITVIPPDRVQFSIKDLKDRQLFATFKHKLQNLGVQDMYENVLHDDQPDWPLKEYLALECATDFFAFAKEVQAKKVLSYFSIPILSISTREEIIEKIKKTTKKVLSIRFEQYTFYYNDSLLSKDKIIQEVKKTSKESTILFLLKNDPDIPISLLKIDNNWVYAC